MFENIGGKIKTLAKVGCWIGIIFCVIYGIVNWVLASEARDDTEVALIVSGFIWVILGPILSWVGSFCLYGFGEAIDRLKNIDQKLGRSNQKFGQAGSSRSSDNTEEEAPFGNEKFKIKNENGETILEKCLDENATEIEIPDSVTSIDDEAFYNCSSLTSVTIPEGVTSIGGWAFNGCSSLTSVTIPDSVTSIGAAAFCGCHSLTSVTIGNGVTSIGYQAFYNCRSLSSVTIPDSVTSIGGFAFRNCSSLTSVTIPSSVTSIGDCAFCGCDSLASITIPDSVTSIGDYAFENCRFLESITFQGTKEQWDTIIKGVRWDAQTGNYTIHCTDGDIA